MGEIRKLLENLKTWQRASDLTLEQVADMFDRIAAMQKQADEKTNLVVMPTSTGKH